MQSCIRIGQVIVSNGVKEIVFAIGSDGSYITIPASELQNKLLDANIGSGGDCVWEMDGIYKEHADLIYKYLFSLCLNAHTAEELTQETFYRAILSINTYNGNCKMSTWLCQIAKHLWYQELDKNSRRKTEPLDESFPDYSKSVESTVLDKQDKMSIYRMLHNLSDPMREVMYLRLSGELSFREIGELLNQSETWARVTFYRGKKKLMEGLE